MVFVPFKKGGWCRRPWCQWRVASVTKRSTFPLECRSQLKWLSVIHPRYERPALRTSAVRAGRPQGKLFGGRSGAEYSAVDRVSDDRHSGAPDRRRAVRSDDTRGDADRCRIRLPGSHRTCPRGTRRGGTRGPRHGRAAWHIADRSGNELCRSRDHPAARGFMSRHPALQIDLMMTDQRQDLVTEGVDLAFRFGALPDSTATARRDVSWPPVPAPTRAYLDKAGIPATPADLPQHAIILGPGSLGGHWSFRKDGDAISLQVEGRLIARASIGAIAAAVAGLGIVMAPLVACRWELEGGELVRLFPE